MKLKAAKREIKGKKVKNIRKQGFLPASVYGPERESLGLSVDTKDFEKLFEKVSYNKFIDLEIEGEAKTSKVLVKEVQIDPLKDKTLSVSFYQVDESRKITVEVPIELENEAPAIKLNLGFLVQSIDNITLQCLPKDVPDKLTVDISVLANTGDSVVVSALKLPEGVEFDSSVDQTGAIVYIAARQKEIVVETTEVAEGAETTDAEASSEAAEEKKEE